MKIAWYIIGITIVLSSCNFWHSPRLKAEKSFMGIRDYNQVKGGQVDSEKFIIIHGIGPQKDKYSRQLIHRINNETFGRQNYDYEVFYWEDTAFNKISNHLHDNILRPFKHYQEIKVLKVVASPKDSDLNKENVFYSINWSSAIDKIRRDLKETEMKSPPYYFGINKLLKKVVMIKRVGDAFNGSEKELVRELHDKIKGILDDIQLKDIKRLNMISGSFGSQLFLGSIIRMKRDKVLTYGNEATSSLLFTPKAIEQEVDLNMFMLTNQVNLMPNNINQWFDFNGIKDKDKASFKSVNIVAFRNPNDLLCYYLPKETMVDFFQEGTKIDVTNAYYFNLLIRNDAASSHAGVFKFKKLVKAIYKGSESNWVKVK